MPYTPYLEPSKPDKFSSTTYVNTPEVYAYCRENSGKALNSQTMRTKDIYNVQGFDVLLYGMCVYVKKGMCILKNGKSAKVFSHTLSKFYLNRQLPLTKSEVLYLAINITRMENGQCVLELLDGSKAVPQDYLCIKSILINAGESDLSNASVRNIIQPKGHKIYNYVPEQPDGIKTRISLPFKISKKFKAFYQGEDISNSCVLNTIGETTINLPSALPTGRLVLDLEILA